MFIDRKFEKFATMKDGVIAFTEIARWFICYYVR